MAALVPCLATLRSEINAVDPDRPKKSDGWIGDTAHAERKSDHNPDSRGLVHAIDVTTFALLEAIVQLILTRCRSGAETRLKYIIFRRRIWSASNGWREQVYDEEDPHTGHAHFSASSTPSKEASRASWRVGEVAMLTDGDKADLRAIVRDEVAKVVSLDADPGERSYSLGGLLTTVERRTADDDSRFEAIVGQVAQIASEVADVRTLLDEVKRLLTPPAPTGPE